MLDSFKKTLEYIGLDYKKEELKILILNLVLIAGCSALLIFAFSVMTVMLCLLIVGGSNYAIFSSYSSKKRKIMIEHSDEFINIISYFRIFISNRSNVYQAFKKVISYSSEWMKEKLEIFLRAIDEDKTIKPFTDLANRFELPIARNVMISIYQMVEQGEVSEQLNQFTVLFEQMKRTQDDETRDRKVRSFDLVSFFPVIGAGLVIIALTFSMLTLVEDMINVI